MKLDKQDLSYRPRRLRKSDNLRRLVRETRLHVDDLVAPIFVIDGYGIQNPIILGHSLGGKVGMKIAFSFPNKNKLFD